MMSRIFVLLFVLCFACSPSTDNTESSNETIEEVSEEGNLTQEYYDEGGLKSEGHLIDGKRNGMWTSYFPDGTIWSQSTYDLDILQGKTKVYYPNGVMRYKGQFREGKRAGKWIEYFEDGKVDFIKEYPE